MNQDRYEFGPKPKLRVWSWTNLVALYDVIQNKKILFHFYVLNIFGQAVQNPMGSWKKNQSIKQSRYEFGPEQNL